MYWWDCEREDGYKNTLFFLFFNTTQLILLGSFGLIQTPFAKKKKNHTFPTLGEMNFPRLSPPHSLFCCSLHQHLLHYSNNWLCPWISPFGFILRKHRGYFDTLTSRHLTGISPTKICNLVHLSLTECIRRPGRRSNMTPERSLDEESSAGTCVLQQFCSWRVCPAAPIIWDGKHPLCTIAKGPITEMKVQLQKNYP